MRIEIDEQAGMATGQKLELHVQGLRIRISCLGTTPSPSAQDAVYVCTENMDCDAMVGTGCNGNQYHFLMEEDKGDFLDGAKDKVRDKNFYEWLTYMTLWWERK